VPVADVQFKIAGFEIPPWLSGPISGELERATIQPCPQAALVDNTIPAAIAASVIQLLSETYLKTHLSRRIENRVVATLD